MSGTLRTLVGGVIVLATAAAAARAAEKKPNVLILYADDLGIGDVGCYGCKDIPTPAIDRLAGSGIRFTNYYSAAPLCAPSRAALLTGRTPARAGMSLYKNVQSEPGEPGLPPEEITIAEVARTTGHATAIVGKWHLGWTDACEPNAQGFDYFFGFHAALSDYYAHMFFWGEPYFHDLYRNKEEIFRGGRHLTELITEESIGFIERNREKPFLLYVAFNAPHYPIEPQDRFREQFAHMEKPRRDYAAMVAGLDDAIGRILAQLDKLGLAEDTLVFFASDNGAPSASKRGEGGGRNTPYREYKRSLFDGGIHMPAALRWPARVKPNQTREQIVIAMDVLPTVAEAIGARLPDRKLDGVSWLPLIDDPKAVAHETLFFEWDDQIAVRTQKWKLVRNGYINMAEAGRNQRATGEDAVFLSDMDADPGETTNTRHTHEEIARNLLQSHEAWRADIPAASAGPPREGKRATTSPVRREAE